MKKKILVNVLVVLLYGCAAPYPEKILQTIKYPASWETPSSNACLRKGVFSSHGQLWPIANLDFKPVITRVLNFDLEPSEDYFTFDYDRLRSELKLDLPLRSTTTFTFHAECHETHIEFQIKHSGGNGESGSVSEKTIIKFFITESGDLVVWYGYAYTHCFLCIGPKKEFSKEYWLLFERYEE